MNVKSILPISVLIPTMNRPETLKRTIQTYMASEYVPSQIVVVDQSQDEENRRRIKAILDACTETGTVYVYQAVPSSTVARNTALRYASEEILVYSDDDVDVYPDTLQTLYSIMADRQISMLAGLDDNSKKNNGWVSYLFGTRSFKKRKIGHVTASVLGRFPNEVKGQVDTEWAMGFFFSVKKSLIEKWGIEWDENLTSYAYAEDLDFSYAYYKKAKAESLRCIYDDRIHVMHLASQEYRIPSKKSTYMYVLNREYLSHKHQMGIKSRLAMDWCNFWKLTERIVKRRAPGDMARAMRRATKLRQNGYKELSSLYNENI